MSVLSSLPTLPAAQEPGKTINGKRVRVPPRVTLGEITPNNVGTLKKLNLCLFPVSYSDRFYRDVLDLEITPEEYSKLVFYQDIAVGSIVSRLEPVSTPAPTSIAASVAPPSTSSAPIASSSSSTPTPTINGTATHVQTQGEASKLYIMTLGVLSPYRRQGLASELVQHVIQEAEASLAPPAPAAVVEEPASKKSKGEEKEKDAAAKEKKEDKKEEEVVKPRARVESLYLHVQVSNEEAKRFWEKHGFEVTGTIANYYRKIEPRDAWVLERKIVAPSA